jgi:inner membrane protein
MSTIFSHRAVPLALGLAIGAPTVSKRLLLADMVASILPDLNVPTFRLGIAYSHELGHRGFSHALAFSLLVGVLASGMAQWLQTHSQSGLCIYLRRHTIARPAGYAD